MILIKETDGHIYKIISGERDNINDFRWLLIDKENETVFEKALEDFNIKKISDEYKERLSENHFKDKTKTIYKLLYDTSWTQQERGLYLHKAFDIFNTLSFNIDIKKPAFNHYKYPWE